MTNPFRKFWRDEDWEPPTSQYMSNARKYATRRAFHKLAPKEQEDVAELKVSLMAVAEMREDSALSVVAEIGIAFEKLGIGGPRENV